MNNTDKIIVPVSDQQIKSIMNKTGIFSKEPSDNDLMTILRSVTLGKINVKEKNQLLIRIIQNQLKLSNKYLNKIKHPHWKIHCSYCGGKGFHVILETKLKVEWCKSCNGTGIKNSKCNRCEGFKLSDILNIRNEILEGTDNKEILKYSHFAKIKLNTINPDFIKQNYNKTFRVFKADEYNGEYYYYIPKSPCKTCNGTGIFVHNRMNIKCSSCNGIGYVNNKECTSCEGSGRISRTPIKCSDCYGKGYIRKQFITTNVVKSFIVCGHCDGLGTIPMNPIINIKNMSNNVKLAVEKLLK